MKYSKYVTENKSNKFGIEYETCSFCYNRESSFTVFFSDHYKEYSERSICESCSKRINFTKNLIIIKSEQNEGIYFTTFIFRNENKVVIKQKKEKYIIDGQYLDSDLDIVYTYEKVGYFKPTKKTYTKDELEDVKIAEKRFSKSYWDYFYFYPYSEN